jgi:hypothetical protein
MEEKITLERYMSNGMGYTELRFRQARLSFLKQRDALNALVNDLFWPAEDVEMDENESIRVYWKRIAADLNMVNRFARDRLFNFRGE